MSETAPSPVAPESDPAPGPDSVVTMSSPPSTLGEQRSGAEVAANLVAALVIGSVTPFLVRWTSPGSALGVPPYRFELIDIVPQLVMLAVLGIALLSQARGVGWLRSSGWLLAAAGLLGVAGLYAQGNTLDGQTLTLALTAAISLLIVGLLVAFARADGVARWAIAIGLAAGISGGRQAVTLVVEALRDSPRAGGGDEVVFAGLGALVGAAGVALLVLRGRDERSGPGRSPSAWWSLVRWPVVALVIASVLAVALTRMQNARLDTIARSYIGGISEADALAVQTQDLLVRVGIAVLVAALLVVAAQRSGGSAAARWVLVAFGIALVLVELPDSRGYQASWSTALVAVAGVAVGAVLVHRLDGALPWDALGLALAAGLLVVDVPSVLGYLGVFGLGLAATAGIVRLAPRPASVRAGRQPQLDRLGPVGVSVAVALGLAVWMLSHQVVVPAAAFYRTDLGGVPILPFGVLLAAGAIVVFALLDRRATRA